MKKSIVLGMVIISMFIITALVQAESREELQAQVLKLRGQIDQINTKYQASVTLLNKAIADLTEAQNEIDRLKKEFPPIQQKLELTQKKLVELEAKEKAEKEKVPPKPIPEDKVK